MSAPHQRARARTAEAVSAGSALLVFEGKTKPSGASRSEEVRSLLGSAGGALTKWSHRGSALRLLNNLDNTIEINGYFDRPAFSARSFMISNRRVFSFIG